MLYSCTLMATVGVEELRNSLLDLDLHTTHRPHVVVSEERCVCVYIIISAVTCSCSAYWVTTTVQFHYRQPSTKRNFDSYATSWTRATKVTLFVYDVTCFTLELCILVCSTALCKVRYLHSSCCLKYSLSFSEIDL